MHGEIDQSCSLEVHKKLYLPTDANLSLSSIMASRVSSSTAEKTPVILLLLLTMATMAQMQLAKH